jgi:threonine dehydratase
MNALPSLAEIEAAARIVNGAIPPTPQFSWPLLNARAGCGLWVKHENHTPIGAFKIRGGLYYIARLTQREPGAGGVILATRGNHGQSIAFAARRYGLAVTIVVPHGNSIEKNQAMRALGAELLEHGEDFQAALEHSQKLAADRSLHWVPSFHRDLVCGNAVSTLNFLQNTPTLTRVYVPIGLGSGICAMIAARNALGLPITIVGVASESAPAIALSFAARRLISHPANTRVADGLACSTPNPDALEYILHGAERIVTVSDDETESAMRAYFTDTHNLAEGAAATALAAVLKEKSVNAGQSVGVVCTGANVDGPIFARVLAQISA